MLRLSDNPPMTLPGCVSLSDLKAPWTVIYCRPRQEKALAHDLIQREVPYFLPLVLRQTSSGGRRRKNLYPLFQSYLFFSGEDREREAVLKTNRVVTFVEIQSVEQAQFQKEISALERGLRSAPDAIEFCPQLESGDWVRVIAGPMAGAEGCVIQAESKSRLLLGVTIMGAGATVEIHPDLVERSAPPAAKRGAVEVVYDLERNSK